MSKDDITIDEVLIGFAKYLTSVEEKSPFETINEDRAEVARVKTQLYELLSSVIGEDELLRDDEQLSAVKLKEVNKVYKARNYVRAEQRQKLTNLFNPTESDK